MGLLDFLNPRKKAEQQLIQRISQATNHFGILILGGAAASEETFFPMAAEFYDSRPQ
jgi:hypothetical protein